MKARNRETKKPISPSLRSGKICRPPGEALLKRALKRTGDAHFAFYFEFSLSLCPARCMKKKIQNKRQNNAGTMNRHFP